MTYSLRGQGLSGHPFAKPFKRIYCGPAGIGLYSASDTDASSFFWVPASRLDVGKFRRRVTAMPTLLDLAADLVSIEPASQATRLLGRMMEHTRATAGAVLVPSDQDLRVFVSRQASLERLSQGRSAVASQRLLLQRGEAVVAEGITLLPLTRDGGLVGVVLLEGGTLSLDGTDLILTAIVAAVMVAMAPRP